MTNAPDSPDELDELNERETLIFNYYSYIRCIESHLYTMPFLELCVLVDELRKAYDNINTRKYLIERFKTLNVRDLPIINILRIDLLEDMIDEIEEAQHQGYLDTRTTQGKAELKRILGEYLPGDDDMSERKARCQYYGVTFRRVGYHRCSCNTCRQRLDNICRCEVLSDNNLPFFESFPNKPYDSFYCGCQSWE